MQMKKVDFLCGIGRSSYRMFIAEAHTVTGEDTHDCRYAALRGVCRPAPAVAEAGGSGCVCKAARAIGTDTD